MAKDLLDRARYAVSTSSCVAVILPHKSYMLVENPAEKSVL